MKYKQNFNRHIQLSYVFYVLLQIIYLNSCLTGPCLRPWKPDSPGRCTKPQHVLLHHRFLLGKINGTAKPFLNDNSHQTGKHSSRIRTAHFSDSRGWGLPSRVPTRTGKPGKMGRHFPVRENSGNF